MLKTFWSSSELTIRTKIYLLVACVFSRLLYAAETWTIKAADSRILLAFEMEDTESVLRRQSEKQHCQRQSRQTVHDSRRGKADEVTTVRAHLQDE